MLLDETRLREMVFGGALLGSGGGGTISIGLARAEEMLRLGNPHLICLDELSENAIVATLSTVGMTKDPSRGTIGPRQFLRALDVFQHNAGEQLSGFIASEVGPVAVTYGLTESLLVGIPVVDAPCNGRAHPLSVMGSLGLHRLPGYRSLAVACGYSVELLVRAHVRTAARLIRSQVAENGASLAVIRNPVPAGYLKGHAAVGALRAAMEIGRILISCLSDPVEYLLETLSTSMGGRVIAEGTVASLDLAPVRGFTLGAITVARRVGCPLSVAVCNEFMAIRAGGKLIAAFPDLVALFDRATKIPLATTEVRSGQEVVLFTVPVTRFIVGSTMRDYALLRPVERLLKFRFRDG